MSNVDHMIKLVWSGWFMDELRDKRIGFSAKYKNLSIPLGSKMLVYITEHQRIMGIYTVTGNWRDGETYGGTKGFPLSLPVQLNYVANVGLSLKEANLFVPGYKPSKDMSYFPLDFDAYSCLEQELIKKG
jgi:hypothetical protein